MENGFFSIDIYFPLGQTVIGGEVGGTKEVKRLKFGAKRQVINLVSAVLKRGGFAILC